MKKSLKGKCLVCAFLLLLTSKMYSLEMGVRLSPVFTFPSGAMAEYYDSVVFGGSFNYDFNFLNLISVGPEFDFLAISKPGESSNIWTFAPGISVSAYFFPFSRMQVRAGLAGGMYFSLYDYPGVLDSDGVTYIEGSEPESFTIKNLWGKIFAEAGFRINPMFSINAGLSFSSFFLSGDDPLLSGLGANVGVQIVFDTVKTSSNLDISLDQVEPVFPLYSGIYKANPVGTLTIKNVESAEIRNVSVSFSAGNYTASLFPCGVIDIIQKNKTAEVVLLADFSQAILNFTEDGKIPGELVINYEMLGQEKTATKSVVVTVYNRNALRWTDASALAAYISPNSPEILEFSKYLVGIARDQLKTGLNRNLQFSMYVIDGVAQAGIECLPDGTTPYSKYHLDPELLDSVQYPFQTLTYRMGDRDEVGILISALLEAVGIKAGIIPLEDDFIVAFSLGVATKYVENYFDGYEKVLFKNDEIWIPVSMSAIREGFINAWYKAVEALNSKVENSEDFEMILLSEAWTMYPPASFTAESQVPKPIPENLINTVETDMARYIAAEFGRKIQEAVKVVEKAPKDTKALNGLGILYVRAGIFDKAIEVYTKSASLGSVPAMLNLANLAVMNKDYKLAESWYLKILQIDPENKGAASGLSRIAADLEM